MYLCTRRRHLPTEVCLVNIKEIYINVRRLVKTKHRNSKLSETGIDYQRIALRTIHILRKVLITDSQI